MSQVVLRGTMAGALSRGVSKQSQCSASDHCVKVVCVCALRVSVLQLAGPLSLWGASFFALIPEVSSVHSYDFAFCFRLLYAIFYVRTCAAARPPPGRPCVCSLLVPFTSFIDEAFNTLWFQLILSFLLLFGLAGNATLFDVFRLFHTCVYALVVFWWALFTCSFYALLFFKGI